MTSKQSILATLKKNKPQLEKLGVKEVGLFGSYARNEQVQSSDIDILIDFAPEKETFDSFMDAYDLMEEIFRNQKVEVVTKNGLSPYIGPKILKEVVYA
jgi:hypothetical protein